jgi:hypothetical protein
MQPSTLTSADYHGPGVSAVAAALAGNAEGVFLSLLGKPTSQTSRELRYGRRGSIACCIAGRDCGRWRSYEDGTHGDLLDLIQRKRGVELPEAMQIAIDDYLSGHALPPAPARPSKPSCKPIVDREDEGKARYWQRLWRDAADIIGTAGHRYYGEVRGIDIRGLSPLGHCIRWHPGISAVVALMRDPITGEPCGLHRTYLDAHAAKIDRRMIGRQGVVELSPREDVCYGLGLTEGIEDGLAVLASGWCPVWASTCAGAIARFPVPEAIDALTIFGDDDEAGNNAAAQCRSRWIECGREVAVVLPPKCEVTS